MLITLKGPILTVVSVARNVFAADAQAGDATEKPTHENHKMALLVSHNFFLLKGRRSYFATWSALTVAP